MTDESAQSTWPTRELPILRAALRAVDAGGDFVELEDIRLEAGISAGQFRVGAQALHDAGYLDVIFMPGWTDDHASGNLRSVHERTRRELGSWPTADDVVDRLVAALTAAADNAPEPEKKTMFRATADTVGGMARDVIVSVVAAQIGEP